jgi:transcriptional regulator with XRE-family HTH domain
MNGPEMKAWRTAAGLTLRDVATAYLSSEVTHTTLSRWEQIEKAIPQWACDIFLGATKVTLAVTELHALLDYARRNNKSFNAVLADAIRHWLSLQPIKPTCTQPGPQRFTITPPAAANDIRVAEDEKPYRA